MKNMFEVMMGNPAPRQKTLSEMMDEVADIIDEIDDLVFSSGTTEQGRRIWNCSIEGEFRGVGSTPEAALSAAMEEIK